MSMDKRLVTWFWFPEAEVGGFSLQSSRRPLNKILAERLRKVADELENTRLTVSPAGNVSDAMGSPFGYFETRDEAKRFTH
jgi:hypothetical protein